MPANYRTVFLSDLHLGMRGNQAREVARLLQRLQCQKLYLVGDIIDMWWLKQSWYWPEDHNDVVRHILRLAKRGTEIIFVPGNHDRAARHYLHRQFAGITIRPHDIHTTADGRRLLVTHGDEYDRVVQHSPLLSHLGGHAYRWLIRVNHAYNRARRLLGLRYWSLAQCLKLKLKQACAFIHRFEHALIQEARRRQLDGVVCGHIHKPAHHLVDGIAYFNCGDWLESCTALVEHACGRMEILDGLALADRLETTRQQQRKARPTRAARRAAALAAAEAALFEDDADDAPFVLMADVLLAHRARRNSSGFRVPSSELKRAQAHG